MTTKQKLVFWLGVALEALAGSIAVSSALLNNFGMAVCAALVAVYIAILASNYSFEHNNHPTEQ